MIRQLRLLVAGSLVVLLAACGQATDNEFGAVGNTPHEHSSATASGSHAHATTGSAAAGSLQPVLATSELVVGPNRLALGILEDNVPIKDAPESKVHVRYYKLNGNNATLVGEEDAQYYGEGLGDRGTFIVKPSFDAAGTWGLEVQTDRPGKGSEVQRMSLDVKATSAAPMIGADAPKSKTPTANDVPDLKQITSATTPDPVLYQMSVDQAVSSGKPSLIMFATPGYCQTAVCGPGVDVLGKLKQTFGDKLNAVHVEVYQLPYDNGKLVQAMNDWGIQTEPWLFLVDKAGKIAGRYEGGITFAELQPDVARLVAQ